MPSLINMIALVIMLSISIFIITVLYTWIDSMEKDGCDCSEIWHRDIVKYGLFVIILLNILVLFSKYYFKSFSWVLSVIAFILTVSYWAIVLDYTLKLKELSCKCSEGWKREFAYIYSIVYMIFISLTMLIIMAYIFFFIYTMAKLS
jgi:hypothetical protein